MPGFHKIIYVAILSLMMQGNISHGQNSPVPCDSIQYEKYVPVLYFKPHSVSQYTIWHPPYCHYSNSYLKPGNQMLDDYLYELSGLYSNCGGKNKLYFRIVCSSGNEEEPHLALKRALLLKKYLVKHAILPDKIIIVNFNELKGEERIDYLMNGFGGGAACFTGRLKKFQ